MADLRVKVEITDVSTVSMEHSPNSQNTRSMTHSPVARDSGLRSPVSLDNAPVARGRSPTFHASENSAFVRVGHEGSPPVLPQSVPPSHPLSVPLHSYTSTFPFLLDPSRTLGMPPFPLSPMSLLPLPGNPLTPDHALLKFPDLMAAYRDPRIPITSFWLHRARALQTLHQGALVTPHLYYSPPTLPVTHTRPRSLSPKPRSVSHRISCSVTSGHSSQCNPYDACNPHDPCDLRDPHDPCDLHDPHDPVSPSSTHTPASHALSVERLVSKENTEDAGRSHKTGTGSGSGSGPGPGSGSGPGPGSGSGPGPGSGSGWAKSNARSAHFPASPCPSYPRPDTVTVDETDDEGDVDPDTTTSPLSSPLYPPMGLTTTPSALYSLPHPHYPAYLGLPGRRPRDPSKAAPAKKYKCDLCGKAFSRSNTLVTHRVSQQLMMNNKQ